VADIKVFVTELGSYYSEASENVSSRLAELILLPRPSLPAATGHSTCTRLSLVACVVSRTLLRKVNYMDFIR
jgi:hypothetical protein